MKRPPTDLPGKAVLCLILAVIGVAGAMYLCGWWGGK